MNKLLNNTIQNTEKKIQVKTLKENALLAI